MANPAIDRNQFAAASVPPLAVDIATASNITSLSRSRIYEMLASGQIRGVHVGRRHLITMASLQALFDQAA